MEAILDFTMVAKDAKLKMCPVQLLFHCLTITYSPKDPTFGNGLDMPGTLLYIVHYYIDYLTPPVIIVPPRKSEGSLRRRGTIRFPRTEPADFTVHGSIVKCD